MAEVYTTPDGSRVIFSTEDIIDLIREYISDDVADYCEGTMVDIDAEKLLAEEKAKTDEDAIASENSSLRDALYEVKARIEQLVDQCEKHPKTPKFKIMTELEEIINYIDKEV